MKFIRYEDSRPADMRRMLEEAPIAWVPFGALEWHGEHAPLGLDGVKAHYLCVAAAERIGGVVFPTVFWGAFDTMPFPFTFHFKKQNLAAMVRQMLAQLDDWGFKAIVLLTGHYPPTQIKMLKTECRAHNKKGKSLAFGTPEQVFAIDLDYYGDHAGMWETSIMMAIDPDAVDMSAMPGGLPSIERLEKFGVMGQDPISKAGVEKGKQAIETIAQRLAETVERAMAEKSDRAFEEVYSAYEKALSPLSPRIFRVARKALDVKSITELIRMGLWTLKNL